MDKYQNWHTMHRSSQSFKPLSLSLTLFSFSAFLVPMIKQKKGRAQIIGQPVGSPVKKN